MLVLERNETRETAVASRRREVAVGSDVDVLLRLLVVR
jgi:hypothetical protein